MSKSPAGRSPGLDRRHLLRGAAGLAGLGLGGPLALTASSTLAAGVDTSLPYGGQYLGCPSYAGGKANNGFWDRHAYRFVAERSGAIKNVRWENQTGTGYSIGNGGSVQISIQTNSGGYPSGQKLGYTGVYANAATLGLYPVYTFSAQPQLVYGTTYHLVFQQVAASQGMTSVNDLADWVAPPDGLSIFPLQKSTLASIRYQNNAWKVMPGQIPIYDLTYADGTAKGQPMMGGGRPNQQPIAGGNMARQSFDMYGPSATVYGIYFALYRTAAVGPLTIRITNSSNKVLFQTSVDGNQVSTSSSGDTSPLHWLYVPTSPTTFAAGGIYYVSFQAGAGGGLWALPINNGYFYGFRNSSCTYLNRSAQYSTSGGASWGWWPMSGGGVSSWMSLPVFLKTFA